MSLPIPGWMSAGWEFAISPASRGVCFRVEPAIVSASPGCHRRCGIPGHGATGCCDISAAALDGPCSHRGDGRQQLPSCETGPATTASQPARRPGPISASPRPAGRTDGRIKLGRAPGHSFCCAAPSRRVRRQVKHRTRPGEWDVSMSTSQTNTAAAIKQASKRRRQRRGPPNAKRSEAMRSGGPVPCRAAQFRSFSRSCFVSSFCFVCSRPAPARPTGGRAGCSSHVSSLAGWRAGILKRNEEGFGR